MDEMHISGNLFNKLAEKAIKLWVKRNIGFDPKLAILDFKFDLKEDKFSVELKAKGSVSEIDRNQLLNYFIRKKEKGA